MPSDIWSLGCVLHEMCAKKVPFKGKQIAEVAGNILQTRPRKIPSIYSQDLRTLVDDMLHKNPKRRPTINEILCRPFLKFKVMALLGTEIAQLELGHTIFHGLPSGKSPEEFKQTLKLQITDDHDFVFMGRSMKVEGTNPSERAQYVKEFIDNLITEDQIEELRKRLISEDYRNLSPVEEHALFLLAQLVKYKEIHHIQ